MTWTIVAFAFATLGSKVLLGLWVVWIVLPDKPECCRCDGITTQIEARHGLRGVYRICRIQRRWCPECGESFLARGRQPPQLYVGASLPEREPVPAAPQVLERRSQ